MKWVLYQQLEKKHRKISRFICSLASREERLFIPSIRKTQLAKTGEQWTMSRVCLFEQCHEYYSMINVSCMTPPWTMSIVCPNEQCLVYVSMNNVSCMSQWTMALVCRNEQCLVYVSINNVSCMSQWTMSRVCLYEQCLVYGGLFVTNLWNYHYF